MFRRVHVQKHERAVAFRRGQARLFRPGAHWLLGFGWKVVRHSARDLALHVWTCVVRDLMDDASTWGELAFANPRGDERALVWIDGALAAVVGCGPRAFWRVGREVRVENVAARSLRLAPELVQAALAAEGAHEALEFFHVPTGFVGILVLDEKVHSELAPGHHAAWRGIGALRLELVPTSPLAKNAGRALAWTRDQATVRLEPVVSFRVTSARDWVESGGQAEAFLRAAALGAARIVAGRSTLGRLLGDPRAASLAVEALVAEATRSLPVEILGASLGRVEVVRRAPRPRFRGFGAHGREVAAALTSGVRPRAPGWVPAHRGAPRR